MGGSGGSGAGEFVLACTPTRVDFFETYVDEAATRLVICENLSVPGPHGRPSISLDRLEVEGSGFSAAWHGSPPAALEPGAAVFVDVRFVPPATGSFVGRLVVGGDDAVAEVPLIGLGYRWPACDHLDSVPALLRFGAIIGGTATVEFFVENDGAGPCEIERIAECEGNPPAITLVGGPHEHVRLEAGAWKSFLLQLSSTGKVCGEGPEGCLEFLLGDTGRVTTTIDCTDPAQLSSALLAPDRLDFGEVAIGQEARRSFQVIDNVSAPIAIEAIELAGGSSPAFAIAGGPSVGQVLAPGTAETVTVSYTPDGPGVDESAVFVFLDGELEPYMVTLRGEGIAP